MSRKDYIAIANMLASHTAGAGDQGNPVEWNEGYEAARLDIGRSIASILRAENPRFDAVSFFEAAKL